MLQQTADFGTIIIFNYIVHSLHKKVYKTYYLVSV